MVRLSGFLARVRRRPTAGGSMPPGDPGTPASLPPPFGIRVDPPEARLARVVWSAPNPRPARAAEPAPNPRPAGTARPLRGTAAPWGRRRAALPRGPRRAPLGSLPVVRRLVAIGLAGALVVPAVAIARAGDPASQPKAPALIAPSLTELDRAIVRTERYLDGLFKPLGAAGAVQSEYYGLPIRVFFPRYRRWVLAGQTRSDRCRPADCPGLTRITRLASTYAAEAYELTFASPARADALRLRARLDWKAGPERYRISVTAAELRDRGLDRAEVWLDDVRVGSFSPRPAGSPYPTYTLTFASTDTSHLRSFRFTVRHATQQAWLYAQAKRDHLRADALARFMTAAGFVPGLDLRATLFGQGQQYPDDLSYRHDLLVDAYLDCRLKLSATPLAYPYRSKACLLDTRPYLWAARHDTFLPTLEAIQALFREGSPDRPYGDRTGYLPGRKTTASATADRLALAFDRLGFGIPRCSPLGCDRERASGLRTFAFGALETLLGYEYGELTRRAYADNVARLALSVQIDDDAVVREGAHGVAYRPPLRGGFYTYWNRQLRFQRPDGVAQATIDRLGMPPEYLGLVPTDSESTFDAYAFLVLYRCVKYSAGCRAEDLIPLPQAAHLAS